MEVREQTLIALDLLAARRRTVLGWVRDDAEKLQLQIDFGRWWRMFSTQVYADETRAVMGELKRHLEQDEATCFSLN